MGTHLTCRPTTGERTRAQRAVEMRKRGLPFDVVAPACGYRTVNAAKMAVSRLTHEERVFMAPPTASVVRFCARRGHESRVGEAAEQEPPATGNEKRADAEPSYQRGTLDDMEPIEDRTADLPPPRTTQ